MMFHLARAALRAAHRAESTCVRQIYVGLTYPTAALIGDGSSTASVRSFHVSSLSPSVLPIAFGRYGYSLTAAPFSDTSRSESESSPSETKLESNPSVDVASDSVDSSNHSKGKMSNDKSPAEVYETLNDHSGNGNHAAVISLFHEWVATQSPDTISANESGGITVASKIFNLVLFCMIKTGSTFSQLAKLVKQMEDLGHKPSIGNCNSLLRVAMKEGDSFAAESVFRRLKDKGADDLSYNLLVTTCAMDRRMSIALEYLRIMLRHGFIPSKITYNEVLHACARMRRTRDAIALLKQTEAHRISPTAVVLGELLFSATEAEDPDCCLLVLDNLMKLDDPPKVDQGSLLLCLNLAARSASPELASKAWTALLRIPSPSKTFHPSFHLARIHAHAAAGDFQAAFSHLREFEAGVDSSSAELCPLTSLRPLTAAMSQGVALLDNAYYLLADQQSGVEGASLAALNCVIAGCSFVRDFERAEQTFDELQNTFSFSPNVHTYNALMEGFAKTKQAGRVERLFAELRGKGLKPTQKSYELLTTAFVTSQQPGLAVKATQEMLEAGLIPSRELLIHIYRRSKRSSYSPGVEFAQSQMARIGYRTVSLGEVKRRNILIEAASEAHRINKTGQRPVYDSREYPSRPRPRSQGSTESEQPL